MKVKGNLSSDNIALTIFFKVINTFEVLAFLEKLVLPCMVLVLLCFLIDGFVRNSIFVTI